MFAIAFDLVVADTSQHPAKPPSGPLTSKHSSSPMALNPSEARDLALYVLN